MRTLVAVLAFGISGLTLAAPPMGLSNPSSAPAPPAAPTPTKVSVVMTAVTLADDCGASPGPTPSQNGMAKSQRMDIAREMRRCEQSSMQLSVTGGESGAPVALQVKKVELFDASGALIGELTPRSPTVWSEGGVYQPWDQLVAAGKKLSVSYALSQPNWSAVKERWNKTFVVRAVISVGGGEQTVQKDIHTAAPPTSLPANVRT